MLTINSSHGNRRFRAALVGAAWLWVFIGCSGAQADDTEPRNVILITMDGLRWQDLFRGADETLMNKESGGVPDVPALSRRFVRATPRENRQALMPFFWSVIAERGLVFGNPEDESRMEVTNGLNFSYPGYNELLSGFPDPRVDSNSKINNENTTVLEWLHQKPELKGRVAAWCSWDVFPWIINEPRSGIPVNAGWTPLAQSLKSADARNIDHLSAEIPHYFDNVRYDYFTFRGAQLCLQEMRPRVLYVSLGETDDWAHAGRYDLYLDAAARNDDYIRQLWETVQSIPEYRDRTTLILTTDHGRGDNRVDWKSHGKDIADCHHIWAAVLGPEIQPRRTQGEQATQSQIAATVAAVMGYDYPADVPQAAPPLRLRN